MVLRWRASRAEAPLESLAVKTVGARLSVVKQSFFGLPGQYGRRVTKANYHISHVIKTKNRDRLINTFKNLGYDR